MNIKEKDYKQILFLDLKAQGFIKSSQHQTCRSIYKENKKIGLGFCKVYKKRIKGKRFFCRNDPRKDCKPCDQVLGRGQ